MQESCLAELEGQWWKVAMQALKQMQSLSTADSTTPSMHAALYQCVSREMAVSAVQDAGLLNTVSGGITLALRTDG